MKQTDTDFDSVLIDLSSPDEFPELFVLYDGIEFKCAPYEFMFEVPFFRCSKFIDYFHIDTDNWKKFKSELQEIFAAPAFESAGSALLFIRLPEKIKNIETTARTEASEIFSIHKKLQSHFGEAFFFTTSFSSDPRNSFYEAHIMLCDQAPADKDYTPACHRTAGEPYDFLEICYRCQSPCRILHFRIELNRNELSREKLHELIHAAIDESYPAGSSFLPIIQLGLPDHGLTADEWSILRESLETYDLGTGDQKLQAGIGAMTTGDQIEANIYLILNPSERK